MLIVAMLAALYVAIVRERKEAASRHVEITMDYGDFNALAQSYGYDKQQFLIALRRAGLTSLAVSEELGGNLGSSTAATVVTGQSLITQSQLGGIAEPTLAALARTHSLSPSDLYLVVFDPAAVARYRSALVANLGYHAVRMVRASSPTIFAVRTQIDYFGTVGLGLPEEPLELARRLGLFLDPRIQNDERYGPQRIDAIFRQMMHHERTATVIFFGQRNEVLGFPDHLKDTADAFRRTGLAFGSIETYDAIQVQKGNEGLAELAIGRTTRVEAIAKPELDKLTFDTVVARYLLGVRERNVRVVYLRPFLHEQGGLSIEATNVLLVREIAQGLHARGFSLGRATPIPPFRINPVVIFIVSLAVPAMFSLLFEAFGKRRPKLVYLLFAIDVLLVLGGYATHHDLAIRKFLALVGAISFATMGVVAIPRAFTLPAPDTYAQCLLAGLRTLGVALLFALGGALVVIGLLSTPLLMEEISRFSGVKAVIVVPPLVAFALYIYSRRFGVEPMDARSSANAPVRVYQLAALVVLAGLAVVYIARSGNQSDITPSAFELALRSNLTAVLGVRPRFKEFVIGFPLMMLLPALRLEHKRLVGWLFAIGIAIGTSDIVDTFSHLHTPLVVSVLRVVNGAVIGVVIGCIAIALYRAIDRRVAVVSTRRSIVSSAP